MHATYFLDDYRIGLWPVVAPFKQELQALVTAAAACRIPAHTTNIFHV